MQAQLDTPIGPLRLVAVPTGLRAVLWPGGDDRRVRLDAGTEDGPGGDPVTAQILEQAAAQLKEFFDGRRTTFDLPLDPVGTDFQHQAWAVLREIPYGNTISYGAQAAAMGRPRAVRAVGGANGRNPLSIVVPCHRVVGSSGKLTGFAAGVDVKAWLLDHERAVLAAR